MAGNPETRRAQVDAPCPRAVATVTLLFLGLGGCRSYFADTLEVVQRIPLPDSTATILLMDSGERFWVGAPGRITGVDSTGSIVAEVVLPTTSPLDWVAASPARLYFLAGRALGNAALPDRGSSSVVGPQIVSLEVPADAVALDPRDRYVFRTAEYGSLIAHDADTMQPLWGWGAVGGPATAITSTPGGERVYMGIARENGAELLGRDAQTGRTLRRMNLPHAPRALFTGPDGSVYALGWDDEGEGSVLGLRWNGGELEVAWRRSLGDLELRPPLRADLSPSGRLLAILSVRDEAGLQIIDVEAGETVDRLRTLALDLAFDGLDRIFLLAAGEIRRLE